MSFTWLLLASTLLLLLLLLVLLAAAAAVVIRRRRRSNRGAIQRVEDPPGQSLPSNWRESIMDYRL